MVLPVSIGTEDIVIVFIKYMHCKDHTMHKKDTFVTLQ